MKKAIEVSAKFIFILGILGIVYGIFSHEKMTTIYSIGVMFLGFLILTFAIQDFKIVSKN